MVIKSNTLDFLFLKDGERGQAGQNGEDGITLYTWVKYSQNASGNPMTDDPTNAVYIGLAYNKETAIESSVPTDYEWTKIRGDDGQNGANGADGIDAYTVILTNESMTFATDQNRVPLSSQSQTCNVIVMKGATSRSDYTLSFEAPAYITVTQLNKVITLTVSPSSTLLADSTAVNVNVAIDGITFVKTITVAVAKQGIQGVQGIQGLQGEQGIPGTNGTDGKTSYFHIKYSSKANPTVTSDMTETPSTYIGTYVDYDEFDSSDPAKYTWSRFKGENGEQGIPGTNGTNGQTSYLHIKYSDVPSPSSSSEMNDTGGKYIGQYVDFTQQDSSNPSDYTWSRIQGEDGVTIVRTSVKYMATASGEIPDEVDLTDEVSNQLLDEQDYMLVETHWEDTMPVLKEGEFLWTKTEVEYSDGTVVVSYSVGKIGESGKDGVDGKNTYVHLAYSTSQDGSENFSTTIFSGAKYVGFLADDKEKDSILYTDYSWSLFKGSDGADGVSIADVINYYLASSQSSGVTKSTSGWTTTIQNVSASLPYLWNYEEVFDSNGNILNASDPMIIGYYGKDGRDGTNGTDGRSINNVTEYYAVSASDSTAPTEWSTSMQTTTTTLRYLWNYEVITLSDNTTLNTNPRIIGTHGATGERGSDGTSVTILGSYDTVAELIQAHPTGQLGDGYMVGNDLYVWNGNTWQDVGRIKGEDGKDGKDGKDGRGIASTAVTYQKSTSGTTTPTGTWTSTIPEVNPREFLWTRTVITYTDGTTSVAYSVGMMGANGANGTNGTDGADGQDGADGISVTSVSTQYCISTSPEINNKRRIDGTTASWTNAKPQDVADGEYVWTRYVYAYSDNTTQYSNELYDSVITGAERILDTTNGTIKDSVWDKTFVTVIDKETGQPIYKQIKTAVSENNQDIYGLTSRVENVESVIVSKADGSVVTSLQSDVSNLSQRVDGISTNVSSLQTTVNQKADGSTVTTLQNDYTSFKQSSTAFQAEVVSDYAKKSDLPEDLDDFSTVKTLANQTALDFSWFVQGHASSSNLTLTQQGLTLIANNLTIKAPNGSETIISGGKITTESIKSLDNKSWINLSAGTFNYNNNLTWDGTTLKVVGEVVANTGRIGGSTGWIITANKIYSGTVDGNTSAGSVTLSTTDFTRAINGTSRSGLRFAIGSNFGISNTGIVYASGVNISGVITANSGTIGGASGWNIDTNRIYKTVDITMNTSKTLELIFDNNNPRIFAHYEDAAEYPTAVLEPGKIYVSNYKGGVVLSGNTLTCNRVATAGGATYSRITPTDIYENGTALSSKYAALSHSHSYLPLSGGTLTGALTISSGHFTVSAGHVCSKHPTDAYTYAQNSTTSCYASCRSHSNGSHGLYSNGYWNGSSHVASASWFCYRATNGYWYMADNTTVNGNFNVTGALRAKNYGGVTGRVVTSYDTAGGQVGGFRSDHVSRLGVNGQWTYADFTRKYITIGGNWSDIRLKEHLKPVNENAIDFINKINLYSFDWKGIEKHRGHQNIGIIADELEKLDSGLVSGGGEDEDGTIIPKDINTLYLSAYEVKAIQELSAQNNELKDKISALENIIEKLVKGEK